MAAIEWVIALVIVSALILAVVNTRPARKYIIDTFLASPSNKTSHPAAVVPASPTFQERSVDTTTSEELYAHLPEVNLPDRVVLYQKATRFAKSEGSDMIRGTNPIPKKPDAGWFWQTATPDSSPLVQAMMVGQQGRDMPYQVSGEDTIYRSPVFDSRLERKMNGPSGNQREYCDIDGST